MPVDVDMAIVGAGPTGLYAAYYAGFRGMSVAVVDSLTETGGQLIALYPEKPIYDVAGFPEVLARDLAAALVRQAESADPQYFLGARAQQLTRDGADWRLTLDTGQQVQARAVLLTVGIGTFSPRPLPAGEEWLGRGLRYVVTDLGEFDGKDVLVVGGGDSAVDWAMVLRERARSVTLIHRRDRFRAFESSVAALLNSEVRVMTPYAVSQIRGNGHIETVDVLNKESGQTETLAVDEVVAALGFVADLGDLKEWGLEFDKRHIRVDERMQTNLPGVFAAGDVVEFPGKVRLISTAFGEAATAVNNAAPIVMPGAKVFPGHSSDPSR
jgi:thioredoxin reductase